MLKYVKVIPQMIWIGKFYDEMNGDLETDYSYCNDTSLNGYSDMYPNIRQFFFLLVLTY